MSDTSPTADSGGFDPGRLRTAPTQMLRSRDDRYIAGVCGGLARYLNIDPVVVRVLMAALTVVGGVGLVVYGAAWLLAPEEGAERSVLESHVPGNPRLRTIGWIVAGVIAVAAVVGSGPWFDWGWVGPFPLLALAILAWILFRPRQEPTTATESTTPPPTATSPAGAASEPDTRPVDHPVPGTDEPAAEGEDRPADDASSTTTRLEPPPTPPTATAPATAPATPPPAPRRPRGDGTLLWLTLAAIVVVMGVLWLVDQSSVDIDGPVYLASGLAAVGVGLLAGTWWGNARALIPAGVALTATLIAVSQLPVWKFGEIDETPTRSADVQSSYEMGAGQIRLDLTHVEDLAALDGRTISIVNGLGQTEVVVPDDLDVTVTAKVNGGNVELLGRTASGADASTQYTDPDDADPDLRLDIDESLGQVEVTRP
jgi:phage shock protein PspC (stress-responsive transcriptional regulator)